MPFVLKVMADDEIRLVRGLGNVEKYLSTRSETGFVAQADTTLRVVAYSAVREPPGSTMEGAADPFEEDMEIAW